MISIIIPIFNENENIRPLYTKLKAALLKQKEHSEIIFINDGSKDQSEKILTEIAADDLNVKIINLKRNFGQTSAMMAGIDFAEGEIIIPMDGDMQNDPDDIHRLIEKINEGYDLVSGWRKNRKDSPLSKNFPSWLANKLISYISGVHLHDYGCSLKAYRRDIIKDVKLYGEMHRFIPIYASWCGAKIIEIPVKHHQRIHGKSNYGLERIFKILFDLIVVKFLSKYANKPIYVFGGFGIFMFCIAFLTGIFSVYLKVFKHFSFIQTPLPLLCIMLFTMGISSFLMGLLAELVMRTYYESQDKSIYLVKNTLNIKDANHVRNRRIFRPREPHYNSKNGQSDSTSWT